MAKNRRVPLWFTIIIFALSVVAVIHTTTKTNKIIIPYINDGWANWDNIEKITIYSEGYYGRSIDEPVIITDEKKIKAVLKTVTDTNKYKRVPEDEYLEGLCSIFVDFGNGCVISMYADENYGTIDNTVKTVADKEGYYYLPEKFHKEITEILKTNEPAK